PVARYDNADQRHIRSSTGKLLVRICCGRTAKHTIPCSGQSALVRPGASRPRSETGGQGKVGSAMPLRSVRSWLSGYRSARVAYQLVYDGAVRGRLSVERRALAARA